MHRAILDTNVFVAAGFRAGSASAALLELAAAGTLVQVWSEATRDETREVLTRIPRLSWPAIEPLFGPEGRVDAPHDLAPVIFVADLSDRKFAALALATGTPLVSSDDDLLVHAGRLPVYTPGAFLRALEGDATSA